jgi:hypothetical protein
MKNIKEIKFLTFMSSLKTAKIISIKIYYECDKTVKKPNCGLEVK